MLYSLALNDKGETYTVWNHVASTPIYQVLSINKASDEIKEVPINTYMEREQSNVKLVFFDSFIYADHTYKFLPEHRHKALDSGSSTEIVQKLSNF